MKSQRIMNLLITTQSLLKKIIEWIKNKTEASNKDPFDLATEDHLNTGPHREYTKQGDED